MKKILALIIVAAFATSAVAVPPKKEVKKHKKFEGTKVPEKAPAKPVAKKPVKK